jgi:hypothetical protein
VPVVLLMRIRATRVRPVLPWVLVAVVTGGCAAGAAGRPVVPDSGNELHAEATHVPSARTSDPAVVIDRQTSPKRFEAWIEPLRGPLRDEVVDRNWHPGCPVPIQDLRVARVRYWGFDGDVHDGPLVLNEAVVDDVVAVFRRLFRAHFPIKHIALAREYRPNADRWNSVRNTTASFNCRPATDIPGSVSQHSYGWAVDINPLQNPYVRGDGSVLRKAAKPYRDRSRHRRGMIHAGDIVVRSFARIGWEWGGHWTTLKDYMHFSMTGR